MTEQPPSISSVLVELMGAIEPFIDTTSGYRIKLEDAGYSPTAAEMLAAHLHKELISMAFVHLNEHAR